MPTDGVLWCQFVDDGEAVVDLSSIWSSYQAGSIHITRDRWVMSELEEWGKIVFIFTADAQFAYRRRVVLHPPDTHP